jgi:hypothetical protein
MKQEKIVPGEIEATSRPSDYHEIAETCANCRWVFRRIEYDEEARYYCTYRASPRPPCMSALMDEDEYFLDRRPAWEAWSKDRGVSLDEKSGVCSRFEPAGEGGGDLK